MGNNLKAGLVMVNKDDFYAAVNSPTSQRIDVMPKAFHSEECREQTGSPIYSEWRGLRGQHPLFGRSFSNGIATEYYMAIPQAESEMEMLRR